MYFTTNPFAPCYSVSKEHCGIGDESPPPPEVVLASAWVWVSVCRTAGDRLTKTIPEDGPVMSVLETLLSRGWVVVADRANQKSIYWIQFFQLEKQG